MVEMTDTEIDPVQTEVDTVGSEAEVGLIANQEEYFLFALYFSLLTTLYLPTQRRRIHSEKRKHKCFVTDRDI